MSIYQQELTYERFVFEFLEPMPPIPDEGDPKDIAVEKFQQLIAILTACCDATSEDNECYWQIFNKLNEVRTLVARRGLCVADDGRLDELVEEKYRELMNELQLKGLLEGKEQDELASTFGQSTAPMEAAKGVFEGRILGEFPEKRK